MQGNFLQLLDSARYLESILWDRFINIDTANSGAFYEVIQGINDDSLPNETTSHYTIRSAINYVQPGANDIVIDIGCGRGRAVCHFARLGVKKVIGIEINPKFSKMAEKNVRDLRGRKAPVEIINQDAVSADLSEGTIFYMFNPFGEKTLCSILNNIELSHKKKNKPVTVIYVEPLFSCVLDDYSWLEKRQDVRIFGNLRIVVYKSKYEN
jgi:precorrin-6B methylase 2